MKIILILIFLIKTSIDSKPIANVRNSEIEDLTSTTVKNNKQIASVFVNHRKNSSRMTLPNNVEWIRTTTQPLEQQVVVPAVGSIFELIFAVSFT